MGYPKDLLSTRAIIKHGKYALIPPEGRVNNVIPNFENCRTSILATPKLGAGFAFYAIEVAPGGKTIAPIKEDGIETFTFCKGGNGIITVEGNEFEIKDGGYVFAPASMGLDFENTSSENWSLLLYRQRYIPVEGHSARMVVGNVNDIQDLPYDEMENVRIKDLLPADLGFDVNFHTLSFYPDGSHPFIETHLQEHAIYFLEGQGMYLIDDQWVPVKKEDFLWYGAYVPQACYCAGRGNITYIYTKDCNRDVTL